MGLLTFLGSLALSPEMETEYILGKSWTIQ